MTRDMKRKGFSMFTQRTSLKDKLIAVSILPVSIGAAFGLYSYLASKKYIKENKIDETEMGAGGVKLGEYPFVGGYVKGFSIQLVYALIISLLGSFNTKDLIGRYDKIDNSFEKNQITVINYEEFQFPFNFELYNFLSVFSNEYMFRNFLGEYKPKSKIVVLDQQIKCEKTLDYHVDLSALKLVGFRDYDVVKVNGVNQAGQNLEISIDANYPNRKDLEKRCFDLFNESLFAK